MIVFNYYRLIFPEFKFQAKLFLFFYSDGCIFRHFKNEQYIRSSREMVKPLKKLDAKPGQKTLDKSVKEDVFINKSYAARDYFMQNKEMFQKYGIVIAIVAAVILFWFYNNKESNERANSQLGIALIDLKTEKDDEAEKKFNFIVEEFSGTDAASRSHYYLGNLALKKNLVSAAKDHFMQVDVADPLFSAAGKAGLALCAEKESNYLEAAKLYEDASESELRQEIKAKYLFSAAINYESATDLAKAKSLYEDIIKTYKDFSQKALVELRLARI
jgi:tetratricopeptide (TPR) repeat protein